jgi:glycosyltransferase involved in cell wall biosynthesis
MTKISAFTFIHNALTGGYPIVEAIHAVQPYVDEIVVVDCASTDGTKELLERLKTDTFIYDVYGYDRRIPLRIINGEWGNEAGETLRRAHSKYIECDGDIIVHFEADEVYDDSLIRDVISHVRAGHTDLSVMRLQLEQNFQRCRWYPEPVHRVFSRLSGVRKDGHTTNQHSKSFCLTEKSGYLWDITNCFRDNWFGRIEAQAKLRNEEPNHLMVPRHCTHDVYQSEKNAQQWVYNGKHWKWTNTPFDIPDILKPLVGDVKYEPRI